ncbi:hatching enzyme 1.2-like [Cloeon dipterum]|uniref:hatching enzyme 1.2-like n=1 Tax=Cloeon dipterum TaxID=197152 RepID=UPI00322045DC
METKLTATFLCAALAICAVFANPLPEEGSEFSEEDHDADIKRVRMLSLGRPDANVGMHVGRWNPESGINPEELGSYYEGDMLSLPTSQGRNGIINTYYRWPGAIVYYRIQGAFTVNQTALIQRAFDAYHANTCIRFKPYDGTQSNYLIIKSDNSGCWATVGRAGGMQYVNLQVPGCVTMVGTVIHELMHTIGFFHEQSRTDRNQHVNILWSNITPGREGNFDIRDSTAFGVTYDYASVMHYSSKAFSSNGLPTIQTINPAGASIGQRNGFSQKDIQKINAMYNCAV